jgi:protein transport protein SEC24
MLNDVPSSYFSHLDAKGQRRDKDQRPELSHCSVEFVAPGDYMVRPPQPPVYFFLIDVSEAAIHSGMITSAVNAIKQSLNELPGYPRTQIGFMTFDAHIHFYNLKSSLSAPQMLVVSDIQDIIMPLPEDLLVNLQDSRKVVETLLDNLPSMFSIKHTGNNNNNSSSTIHSGGVGVGGNNNNNNNNGISGVSMSCTGSALLAAKRVIQHIGGKLLLFQVAFPNLGEGSLKMRENPRLLGTDKEHTLLNPEDQ